MKTLVFTIILLTISAFSNSQILQKENLNQAFEWVEEQEYQKAKPILEQFLKETEKLETVDKGKIHFYLSEIYWKENAFQKSFENGSKALSIFNSIDDQFQLGMTFYMLSMRNLVAGNYDEALIQTEKAYKNFTVISDTNYIVKSLCRRAVVFHDIGEYEEGITTCNLADSLYQNYSEKNTDVQAIIWGIKAINYDDSGKSEKAIDIYRAILELKEQLSSEQEIIRTYNNMGYSLLKLGYLDEAEIFIKLNLKANIERHFDYGIATAKTNLGTIAFKKGDFESAESFLNEAEIISYEIADAEKILDVLQQKSKMYEAMDKPENSIIYLRKYYNLKDSLYGLDKQRQIQLLQKRFESDQKEQQIKLQKAEINQKKAVLLRNQVFLFASIFGIVAVILIAFLNRNRIKKKQEIRLQEERLKTREKELEASINTQEKERARFARDLHDGIGQFISLLTINLTKLKAVNQLDEMRDLSDQSNKIINSMQGELKNICFDIMPQTLLQSGLQEALNEFVQRVNQSGKIHLTLNAFGYKNEPQENLKVSIYRIVQEWVNNVIKYTNAKEVLIQLTADKSEITLLIEDDGEGFNTSLLFESKGNGWRNILSRANFINASVDVESKEGVKGTTLILDVELKKGVNKNTVLKV